MPSLVFASFAVALALSQMAPVQKPDFSAIWTMDPSRSQSDDSATLTIKQSATEITIETVQRGVTSKRTYPIELSIHGGTEPLPVGHSHARWDNTKLVTEFAGEISGQTVSYKQTRWLNVAGTEMTVESLVIVQHGYSLQGTRNNSTAKDIYVRVK